MKSSLSRLAAKTSVISVALALTAGVAHAQAAPASAAATQGEDTKEIVVTGSSLKGVAPVGSAVFTLGHAQIEDTAAQSVQQVLKSAPAVTGLQAPSQGGFGSSDNSGTNAPTIHGLGASASNSTLVLLNGHRLPLSGANHALADPNILPTIALERVEVLADGASSVYGSDAVAGVINFITRKKFDGLEADVQKGFGDSYNTFGAQALYGKTWDAGSFLVAYSYSNRSNLAASARSYSSSLNLAPLGGTNQGTNKCGPASVTYAGNTYYNSGSGYSAQTAGFGAQAGGICSPTAWDLLPKETRHTAFAEFRQDIGDKLHIIIDADYSNRKDVQNFSRGTATATITSANPFYQNLSLNNNGTPVTTGTASYALNFDADSLFGPGAVNIGTAEDVYGRLDATYDLSKKWSLNVGGLVARDHSQIFTQGTLNSATFNLAVAGTTSATINGIKSTVTQALTAANAFDPFNGATSASTLASLIDSNTYYTTTQNVQNAYAKISGELFDLPGGAVKLSVGGELLGYSVDQAHTALNGLGGASGNSLYIPLHYGRNVASVYGELYLPLVKNSFVKSFEIILSGRYDHYSDFGGTTNPKIAANFEPVQGIKFRANWSKSFVAPSLFSIGANSSGQTGESAFTYGAGSTASGGLAAIPVATYPSVTSIPGAVCTAAGPTQTCSLQSVTGAQISGGQAGLQPQKGTDWSVGFDFTPVQVPGLRISATYWSDQLRNGITAPQTVYAFSASSLSNLLTLYPAGATSAQIAAAQGILPQTNATSPVYWIYNFEQNNVLNLDVAGIDVEAMYRFKTPVGNFTFDGSLTRKTKFNQFFGTGGTVFSVLGTTGFNTTFPSLKLEGRANIAYDKGPFNFVLGVNYEGPYLWWGGTAIPALTKTNGVPTGGGEPVSAFTTVDLHASYSFKDVSVLKKANLFVDVSNLFNTNPPFVNATATNGAVGYDSFSANPLGRVITIGLRTKF